MIIKDILNYGERQFVHIYSNAGFMIECNGIQYQDVTEPIDSSKCYKETDILISSKYNKE